MRVSGMALESRKKLMLTLAFVLADRLSGLSDWVKLYQDIPIPQVIVLWQFFTIQAWLDEV